MNRAVTIRGLSVTIQFPKHASRTERDRIVELIEGVEDVVVEAEENLRQAKELRNRIVDELEATAKEIKYGD